MINLVTIRTFDNYIEANIVMNALHEEGIEAILLDENTVTANWLWSNAIGGIKLQVREEDKIAAEEILKQIEKAAAEEQDTVGFYEDTEQLDPGNRICIYCGSKNTAKVEMDKRWSLAAILALGFPLLIASKKWHCFHCGKKF